MIIKASKSATYYLPCSVLGTLRGDNSFQVLSSPKEKNSTESNSWSSSSTPPLTKIPLSSPKVTRAQAWSYITAIKNVLVEKFYGKCVVFGET